MTKHASRSIDIHLIRLCSLTVKSLQAQERRETERENERKGDLGSAIGPIPNLEPSLQVGSPIWVTIPAIPCQLNENMCSGTTF